MYEKFKGGPRTHYVALGTQVRHARIEDCLYRRDKIRFPKFAVYSNANDLSKDIFGVVLFK